jgi:hypothetical protein
MDSAQKSDLAPFYRDLSQNEKLSEIKPPLLSVKLEKYVIKHLYLRNFSGVIFHVWYVTIGGRTFDVKIRSIYLIREVSSKNVMQAR